jgi:hypothetical protein
MPYRELTMIDVKEVLRRWSAGQSDRRIGRETGIDRKTVGRYTEAATRLGLARDRELTDDQVHGVAQCVQSRPLVAPSDEWNDVTLRQLKWRRNSNGRRSSEQRLEGRRPIARPFGGQTASPSTPHEARVNVADDARSDSRSAAIPCGRWNRPMPLGRMWRAPDRL